MSPKRIRRKKLWATIVDDIKDVIDGATVEDAIRYLSKLSDEFPNVEDMRIEFDWDFENVDVRIKGTRPENDEEFEHRKREARRAEKREQEIAEKREAHDRAEYERLSKKYGKSGT